MNLDGIYNLTRRWMCLEVSLEEFIGFRIKGWDLRILDKSVYSIASLDVGFAASVDIGGPSLALFFSN